MSRLFRGSAGFDIMDFAREICDPREKGRFIYFEPSPASAMPLVELTREHGTPTVTT